LADTLTKILKFLTSTQSWMVTQTCSNAYSSKIKTLELQKVYHLILTFPYLA